MNSAIRAGLAAGAALLLASGAPAARADQPPAGLWLTQDGGGVIRLSPCGERVCGSIAGTAGAEEAAPGPNCGRQIINAAPAAPNLWKGSIVNPEDGSQWSAELKLDEAGRLVLRGYLGLPVFGATRIWKRYTGQVTADCRMV